MGKIDIRTFSESRFGLLWRLWVPKWGRNEEFQGQWKLECSYLLSGSDSKILVLTLEKIIFQCLGRGAIEYRLWSHCTRRHSPLCDLLILTTLHGYFQVTIVSKLPMRKLRFERLNNLP